LADTDGDGFDDGVEVAAGSDPNDPSSTPDSPEPPSVPALGPLAALLLVGGLLLARGRSLRQRRSA
jgi:hypothetical protein